MSLSLIVLLLSVSAGAALGVLAGRKANKKANVESIEDFKLISEMEKVKIIKDVNWDFVSNKNKQRPMHLRDVYLLCAFITEVKKSKDKASERKVLKGNDFIQMQFSLTDGSDFYLRNLGRGTFGVYSSIDEKPSFIILIVNESDFKLNGGYDYSIDPQAGIGLMSTKKDEHYLLMEDERGFSICNPKTLNDDDVIA